MSFARAILAQLLSSAICLWSTSVPGAVPEFVMTPPAASLGMDGAAGDQFGTAAIIDGDRAYVGVPTDDLGDRFDAGSVAVFQRNGAIWQLSEKLVAPDTDSQLFGRRVVVDDGIVYVQAGSVIYRFDHHGAHPVYLDRIVGSSDGAVVVHDGTVLVGQVGSKGAAVTVYAHEAGGWVVRQQLVPDGGSDRSDFGGAMAIAGNQLVVGSASERIDFNHPQGAAYLYAYSQGQWVQTARIQPLAQEKAAQFGCGLAMDSQWLIVGACAARTDNVDSGAAFVYALGGASPVQLQRLQAVTPSIEGQFGYSLALDGNRLAIGMHYHAEHASVDVFGLVGGSWTPISHLDSPTPSRYSGFGVALSLAGDQLLAGIPRVGVNAPFAAGAACFATINSPATPVCEVLSAGSGHSDQRFGTAMAAVADTLAIGGDGGDSAPGEVRLYDRLNDLWVPAASLRGANRTADAFGAAVALDGGLLAVGAPDEFDPEISFYHAGAVYPWHRAAGQWVAEPPLRNPGLFDAGQFGQALSISDGWLAVAAPSDRDPGSGNQPGAVFLYRRVANSWQFQTRIAAPQPSSFGFGVQVAMHVGRLLIGSPYDNNEAGFQAGIVYAYRLQDNAWTLEQNVVAPASTEDFAFGERLALHGNRALIRSQRAGEVVVHALDYEQGHWQSMQELTLPAGSNASITALALDAEAAVLGVADGSVFGVQSTGKVIVFVRSNDEWLPDTEINAPPGSPSRDRFAETVLLTNDDVLVSSPRQSAPAPFGNPYEGAVYGSRRATLLLHDGFEAQ